MRRANKHALKAGASGTRAARAAASTSASCRVSLLGRGQCRSRWFAVSTLPARNVVFSEVVMTELVLPQHTNMVGTCFGGTILSWIDIAAGICAGRHAGRTAVTVAFDDVEFHRPIRLGDIVNLRARIAFVGRTSMEIDVDVFREQMGGEREHTNTAHVAFVAVDAQGRPVPVPPLALTCDDDQARCDAAIRRRALRLAQSGRAMVPDADEATEPAR